MAKTRKRKSRKRGSRKRSSRKRRSRKRGSRKSSGSTPDFVVTSRVKEYLNSKGYRADGELVAGINALVKRHLERGMDRADDNGRKTVRPSDV